MSEIRWLKKSCEFDIEDSEISSLLTISGKRSISAADMNRLYRHKGNIPDNAAICHVVASPSPFRCVTTVKVEYKVPGIRVRKGSVPLGPGYTRHPGARR